jgi:multidrug resistance efflux pump
MVKRMVRTPFSLLLLPIALEAAVVLTGCEAGETTAKPVRFVVKRGKLRLERSFYGELVARRSIAIHTPEFPGVWQLTVESVEPDGTKVKKGDVILKFATGLFEDELQDQEAQLAVARAEMLSLQLTLARERIELMLAVKRAALDVERAKLGVMVGVNLISKVELEKAKIALQQAELALSLAKKALASFGKKKRAALKVQKLKVDAILEKATQKRQHISSAQVSAPASGVLFAPYTRLNWVRGKVSPGSVTRPGDKILEIPALDAFDVAVYARERDASLLHIGDTAVVVPTVLPGKQIHARIVKKEGFASTRNERLGLREPSGNLKEIKVVLRLDKSFAELRPGGTVRADLSSVSKEEMLLVPLVALDEKPAGGYRAQLENGRWVGVEIGRVSATHGEVVAGLKEGQTVVLARRRAASRSDAGPATTHKGVRGFKRRSAQGKGSSSKGSSSKGSSSKGARRKGSKREGAKR